MRSTEAESFLFLGPTGPRVIDELVNREDQAHPSQKKKLGTWPHKTVENVARLDDPLHV